jgi:hypothetical protein
MSHEYDVGILTLWFLLRSQIRTNKCDQMNERSAGNATCHPLLQSIPPRLGKEIQRRKDEPSPAVVSLVTLCRFLSLPFFIHAILPDHALASVGLPSFRWSPVQRLCGAHAHASAAGSSLDKQHRAMHVGREQWQPYEFYSYGKDSRGEGDHPSGTRSSQVSSETRPRGILSFESATRCRCGMMDPSSPLTTACLSISRQSRKGAIESGKEGLKRGGTSGQRRRRTHPRRDLSE